MDYSKFGGGDDFDGKYSTVTFQVREESGTFMVGQGI